MGLDISAYSQVKKANGNEAFDNAGEIIDGWAQFYVNHDYPERADSIEHKKAYKYKNYYGFCAGSYGRYNAWRNELAKLAGYPEIEYTTQYGAERWGHDAYVWRNPVPGPFMELINFSDCEGIIGPNTSEKLAKDFKEFQTKADNHPDEYFRAKYKAWRKAFEMASDGGCVQFW